MPAPTSLLLKKDAKTLVASWQTFVVVSSTKRDVRTAKAVIPILFPMEDAEPWSTVRFAEQLEQRGKARPAVQGLSVRQGSHV